MKAYVWPNGVVSTMVHNHMSDDYLEVDLNQPWQLIMKVVSKHFGETYQREQVLNRLLEEHLEDQEVDSCSDDEPCAFRQQNPQMTVITRPSWADGWSINPVSDGPQHPFCPGCGRRLG